MTAIAYISLNTRKFLFFHNLPLTSSPNQAQMETTRTKGAHTHKRSPQTRTNRAQNHAQTEPTSTHKQNPHTQMERPPEAQAERPLGVDLSHLSHLSKQNSHAQAKFKLEPLEPKWLEQKIENGNGCFVFVFCCFVCNGMYVVLFVMVLG